MHQKQAFLYCIVKLHQECHCHLMLYIKLNVYGKVGATKAPKVQDLIEHNLDGSMLTVFKIGFFSEALPCIKKLDWRKVIIGDNLSEHIKRKVTKACQQNSLSFISLPPNITYLTQPLGITFFWSVKSNWKEERINKKSSVLPKDVFPSTTEEIIYCNGRKRSQ